jgi:hypothetical protein
MALWLKLVGSSDWPMPKDMWLSGRTDLLTSVGFPKNPSVRAGDQLVYYAVGPSKVIGIVSVVSDPVQESGLTEKERRWGFRCKVTPRIAISEYARAPDLEDLEPPGRRPPLKKSIPQKSHIRLTQDEFDRAVSALEVAFDGSRGDVRV